MMLNYYTSPILLPPLLPPPSLILLVCMPEQSGNKNACAFGIFTERIQIHNRTEEHKKTLFYFAFIHNTFITFYAVLFFLYAL